MSSPFPAPSPYPPRRRSHTLRNVIVGAVIVFVLMVAGCMAVVGMAANEVDKAIEQQETEVGGTNVPLDIEAGKRFDVRGFAYSAGWKIKADDLDYVDVTGLKVTNGRGKRDSALVEIKLWDGTEVVAVVDCTTEPILPDTSTRLGCTSADKFPKRYDRVTISDTF